MEEVLAVMGFGVGASLGMGIVRALSGGVRPVVKEVIKAGMAVSDFGRAASSGVGEKASAVKAETGERLQELHAEAVAERGATKSRGRTTAGPRKIAIAKD